MKFNGTDIAITELSLPQLQSIDNSIEAFLFKELGEEPYEPSFKQDPKIFKKFINLMVAFKSDIMRHFRTQYENRYSIVNQHVVKFDEYDAFLYPEEWDKYEDELTKIIESFTSQAFDLGALALAASTVIAFDYGHQEMQKYLIKHAEKVAGDITTTTKKRVKTQIKAAMDLQETRTQFDQRLKKVFENPYRGRFIAQQEAIDAYMEGKEGLALKLEFDMKTALSSQAIDLLCGGVNGETVPIDQPFSNGFMKPRYHFGCKCDVAYSRSKK